MKNLILFALAVLLYGCSKDDETKPAAGANTPELQMWVSSNHKYPILEINKDMQRIAYINEDVLTTTGTVYYSQATVAPGTYKFYGKAWNQFDQMDTNMVDNRRLWVKCVIVLKGDTICNGTDSADVATPNWAILIINKVVN